MIFRQLTLRPLLILLVSGSFFVFFIALRTDDSSVSASRQSVAASVKSLVPKLTVVDAHVDARVEYNAVSLSIRNDYDKIITAFAVSSSGVITRSELIDSDELFRPGVTKTKLYELPSSTLPQDGTIIQAALFEDGTSAGNPKIIKQIRDARAGNKAQTDRIVPILILDERNGDLRQELEKRKSRISELPDQEDGRSFEFNAALQDAKHLAMMKVDELVQVEQRHGETAARRGLAHIKELYVVRSTKLKASLRSTQ